MLVRADSLVSCFATHLARLERTRVKVETLAATGQLSRQDVERVYEGLFLNAFAYFENLIEELFIGILSGTMKRGSRVVPRVSFKSSRGARKVVFHGRQYVDWFPYPRTIQLARVFYREGRPFTKLGKPQRMELHKLSVIRNAIAHKSRYARRTFRNDVVSGTYTLPRERTPAAFLRAQFRISPPQTRFEVYTAGLLSIARTICG